MKYLLDTHALIWWTTEEPEKIGKKALEILASPSSEIYVSAATAWEIATKVRLGKLQPAEQLIHNFSAALHKAQFFPLDITVDQARTAGMLVADRAEFLSSSFPKQNITLEEARRQVLLPVEHKDPFDRMLAAQALDQHLTLISNDSAFDRFGVQRLW